jgi:hypothetical protein
VKERRKRESEREGGGLDESRGERVRDVFFPVRFTVVLVHLLLKKVIKTIV